MLRKKLWLLSLMMMLVGCGGGSAPKEARSPHAGYAPESAGGADAVQSVSESSPPSAPPAASPAPAPGAAGAPAKSTASADAQVRTEESRAPESRPGLGTEWGESRTSRVHDVAFVRDSGRPFAIAQFNYDDRRGVDALVAAQGRRDSSRGIDTAGGAVTVSLRNASGDPLEAIRAAGRTFVVGQAGERYAIVLENHTSHRFEAVATVDGLDVINGKDGSLENRGYVLMPFATLEIEGFRQSAQSVAAFRFAAVSDSYATQRGKPRNIGVIGVAFFSERGDSFVPSDETRIRNTASPFPSDPRFAPPPPR